ncbi:MAG TPA: amidohydrolase family protein [Vicinamibacterales bacterium]|nr:amidohydrolase family protein [Vicinamibacterales bacterium]
MADLLISGETIAAIVAPDAPAAASTQIDAHGKWVLPGLVDLHTHARVPGYEYKEDFRTASRAAAVGGVTTIVDMPNVEPPTTTAELLNAKREIAKRDCHVDFGHFASSRNLDEIPKLAAAGAVGFKTFQVGGGYPHDPRLVMSDPAELYATFEAIATTGLPCVVHPFSQSLMDYLSAREFAVGRPRDIDTFSRVYTRDIVWSASVAVLLEIQRETNARLHLLHTHAPASLRLIAAAKRAGQVVTAAIDPKYFHLRGEDLRKHGARGLPGGYIVEDEERMTCIWTALDDGTVDVIDSDHAPHTLDDLRRMEADPWTGPWGGPHLEHLLSLLLTDVAHGHIRLERLVALTSENPARLLGLYPKKGALLPGSDADLVVVDPDAEVIPQDEGMESRSAWTPYAGWRLRGAPTLTMLRGRVIAKDGQVLNEPGSGRPIESVPQVPVTPAPASTSPGLALAPAP